MSEMTDERLADIERGTLSDIEAHSQEDATTVRSLIAEVRRLRAENARVSERQLADSVLLRENERLREAVRILSEGVRTYLYDSGDPTESLAALREALKHPAVAAVTEGEKNDGPSRHK